MPYLLIDTCSLLQLVTVNGYSSYISELENLINSHRLQLVTHETVIQEWNKHKDAEKRRKERTLLFYEKKQEQKIDSDQSNYNVITTDHLDYQFQKIDELLSRATVELITPDIIKQEFHHRYRNHLAPFLSPGKNNLNDWEIFGSAGYYCSLNGIKDLIFISDNHKEFADSKNIHRAIHPDLQARFENIKIEYFKSYKDFFDFISNTNNVPLEIISVQLLPDARFRFSNTIKKTILESLYYLLFELYEEVNFLPLHILVKHYPFASSEDNYAYYNYFKIYHANEKLIDFLKSFELRNDNIIEVLDSSLYQFIPDHLQKIRSIIRQLNVNLIFGVEGEKSRDKIELHYNSVGECDCTRCSFNRFDFYASLKSLENTPIHIYEKTKLAYFHYKLGNYKDAVFLYKEIEIQAKEERKLVTYFLARYNLRHLGSLLSNIWYYERENEELIKELKEIDPLEDAVRLKGLTNYNLLNYIAQEDYFNTTLQNVQEKSKDIISHYYSQLHGGWSSNQFVGSLICEFAQLYAFLNENFIIFDNYSNFEKLFDIVFDGLIASHAISKNQDSRLLFFNDFWVEKIILYGNRKSITTYCHRYDLQRLEYKSSDKKQSHIIKIAENLFGSGIKFKELPQQLKFTESEFFDRKYSQYIDTFIALSAYLKLNNEAIQALANLLLSFFSAKSVVKKIPFESIRLFIYRKRKYLSTESLKSFFKVFLAEEQEFDDDVLITITSIFKNNSIGWLTQEDLDRIISFSAIGDNKSSRRHDIELLARLHSKIQGNLKNYISDSIKNFLIKTFDFSTFYVATMYEVIPFDINKFDELIESFDIKTKNKTARGFFGDPSFNNYRLSSLFNLMFKYKIDLTQDKFQKFKNVHPYYDWLIDMDNFNYQAFDIEWLFENNTIYFERRMARSKNLLKEIAKLLKKQKHKGVEEKLIKLSY